MIGRAFLAPSGRDQVRHGIGRIAGPVCAVLVVLLAPGCKPAAEGGGGETVEAPEVPVEVSPVVEDTIERTREVYGTIVLKPQAVFAVSVPFEAEVERVLVAPGERVEEGQTLVVVGPSPDTKFQLREAERDLSAVQQSLQQVRERLASHLATNSDVLQAEQAAGAAALRLDDLHARGGSGPREVGSPRTGVVRAVASQAGQVIAAGSALAEVAPDGSEEAQIGIPAGDAGLVSPGQQVRLWAVQGDRVDPVMGEVRVVPVELDQQTRMVQLRVSTPADAGLRLGAFVRAEITLGSARGLVVPRAAVVPEGDGFVVFTVRDGRAVRHEVAIGIESGDRVEIASDGLAAGALVVTAGSSELSDGMAVAVRSGR